MQQPAVGARERSDAMSRNVLYLVIGLLAAGVLIVGYLYYQENQSGIDIEIGEQGVTIEGNEPIRSRISHLGGGFSQ